MTRAQLRQHSISASATASSSAVGPTSGTRDCHRYNELADRKLRGPGTRSETRELRDQIGERSKGLDRLNTELDDAQRGMREREQFQANHAHDAGLLDAVEHELDRQLRSRARQIAAAPTDHHLHILGPVPTDPEHQATWLRGAIILDRHYLGLDRNPAQRERSSLLGGPREMAEMMAGLEVMAIPQRSSPSSERSSTTSAWTCSGDGVRG